MDSISDGLALADREGLIALWNHAAEAITGYSGAETVGRPVREMLDRVVVGGSEHWIRQSDAERSAHRGCVVPIWHKLAYELPVAARVLVLRDAMEERIGTGVIFHPTECLDALPRGPLSEDSRAQESRTELEERLAAIYEDFLHSDISFGVLWVSVDQAPGLRRSHGARAVEAMLEKLERTLAGGLKPTEEMGRWDENEFLVLSHERNAAILTAHAQRLTGIARTTDFRWWGDRIPLTVSIGAAQAQTDEALHKLLERAQTAMLTSIQAGGNQVTASRRDTCSQS